MKTTAFRTLRTWLGLTAVSGALVIGGYRTLVLADSPAAETSEPAEASPPAPEISEEAEASEAASEQASDDDPQTPPREVRREALWSDGQANETVGQADRSPTSADHEQRVRRHLRRLQPSTLQNATPLRGVPVTGPLPVDQGSEDRRVQPAVDLRPTLLPGEDSCPLTPEQQRRLAEAQRLPAQPLDVTGPQLADPGTEETADRGSRYGEPQLAPPQQPVPPQNSPQLAAPEGSGSRYGEPQVAPPRLAAPPQGLPALQPVPSRQSYDPAVAVPGALASTPDAKVTPSVPASEPARATNSYSEPPSLTFLDEKPKNIVWSVTDDGSVHEQITDEAEPEVPAADEAAPQEQQPLVASQSPAGNEIRIREDIAKTEPAVPTVAPERRTPTDSILAALPRPRIESVDNPALRVVVDNSIPAPAAPAKGPEVSDDEPSATIVIREITDEGDQPEIAASEPIRTSIGDDASSGWAAPEIASVAEPQREIAEGTSGDTPSARRGWQPRERSEASEAEQVATAPRVLPTRPQPAPMPRASSRPNLPTAIAPGGAAPRMAAETRRSPAVNPVGADPRPAVTEQVETTAAAPQASPSDVASTAAPETEFQSLQMAVRQTGLLRMGRDVADFAVDDEGICSVVQFDDQELTLIAKQAGETLLAIKCGDDEPLIYRIAVSAPRQATETRDAYTDLRRSITELYPNANLAFRTTGGRLIVSGRVSSDDEVREILSLIRQVRLVPVVDRLVVGR